MIASIIQAYLWLFQLKVILRNILFHKCIDYQVWNWSLHVFTLLDLLIWGTDNALHSLGPVSMFQLVQLSLWIRSFPFPNCNSWYLLCICLRFTPCSHFIRTDMISLALVSSLLWMLQSCHTYFFLPWMTGLLFLSFCVHQNCLIWDYLDCLFVFSWSFLYIFVWEPLCPSLDRLELC